LDSLQDGRLYPSYNDIKRNSQLSEFNISTSYNYNSVVIVAKMSSSTSIFVGPSFFKAFSYALSLKFLKSISYVGSTMAAYKTKFPPTITMKLHPSLAEARIFFPPNTDKTSPLLPTVFSIHGGGFCMGQPANDDHINARLAANGILVIALPYPLTPANSYPAPLFALVSQMQKALAHAELPIDVSRIGLMGSTSGGNLALAIQQLDEAPEIKATMVFCPIVSFTLSVPELLERRAPAARSVDDFLTAWVPRMEWGYIPAGTSLKDPKLSPKFANLDTLSEWMFVVGAEHDVLCTEAGEMVAEWLGEEYGENGRDEMTGKDGKIRWVLAKGQKHSYGKCLDFQR
jgi:acetyl esterase/lipase